MIAYAHAASMCIRLCIYQYRTTGMRNLACEMASAGSHAASMCSLQDTVLCRDDRTDNQDRIFCLSSILLAQFLSL
jgi:hypothetical protein